MKVSEQRAEELLIKSYSKSNAARRQQTLMDTGLFSPIIGNDWILNLNKTRFMIEIYGMRWLRRHVKFERYYSTEEVFETLDEDTKAALIWHLDILK